MMGTSVEPTEVEIVNGDPPLTWAQRVWCTIPVEAEKPSKYTKPAEASQPTVMAKKPSEVLIVESLINSILDSVVKGADESDCMIHKSDESYWRLPKMSKRKKGKGKEVSSISALSKEVDKSLPKTVVKETQKGMKPACPKQDMRTPSSELKVVGCMVPSTPSKKVHDWDKFRKKELTKGSSTQAEILHFRKYGPSIKLNEKKNNNVHVHWEKFNKKGLTKGSSKELRSVEIHHLRKYGLSIKGLAEYKDMDSGNKLNDDIALTKLIDLMKLIDQLEGMNEDKAKSNKPTKRSKKSRQAKQSVSTETVNSIIESILDSVTNIMEPTDTVSEPTNKLPRMRGGALEDDIQEREETARHIASIAISSAVYHGIKLKHPVPNRANGDCAFESCLDQVNATRKETFKDVGAGRFEYPYNLRNAVVDDLKENITAMGFTTYRERPDDYKKELNKLYKDGIWTIEVADLVIPGIAYTLKKDILIYKTNRIGDKDPISVVRASEFGGEADTNVPIVLCYSGNHYEGLVPVDEENTRRTIDLVQWYLSGTYNITFDEIPVFQDAISGAKRKTSTNAIAGPSGTKRKAEQVHITKKKSITPEKASPISKKTSTAETVPKSPGQSPGKTKEQLRKAAATERVRQHRLNRDAAKAREDQDKDTERKANKRISDPAYGGNDPQQDRDNYNPERRSKRLAQVKEHYHEPEVRAKRTKQMIIAKEKREVIDHDTGFEA
jgi:hypothetical protein